MTIVEELRSLLNSADEPILTEEGILFSWDRLEAVDEREGCLDKLEM
jgi:hypothetical protein